MMFNRGEPNPPKVYENQTLIIPIPREGELPVIETETVIASGNNKLGTVSEIRAKRLLQRMQKGETLADAANNERMKVGDLKDPENPIRASIQQLIGSYFLPPEARKQMVRAGLNKLFAENIGSDDPVNKKIALDAGKMIATDVEVGINTDASGGVVINLGELADVFKQLTSVPAPEIDLGRENDRGSGEDRITEAEFEDIPAGGD